MRIPLPIVIAIPPKDFVLPRKDDTASLQDVTRA
jgi:hypothetical protein